MRSLIDVAATFALVMSLCTGMFAAEPRVIKGKNSFSVSLTPQIKEVLNESNSQFQLWAFNDFDKSFETWDWKPGESPFALVGDFNRDGIKDVALNGHDAKSDLVVAVVSVENGYKVHEIHRRPLDEAQRPFRCLLTLSQSSDSFHIMCPQMEEEDDASSCTYTYDPKQKRFNERCPEL